MKIDYYKLIEELGIEVPNLDDNYSPDNYAQEIYKINNDLNDVSYASSLQIIQKYND